MTDPSCIDRPMDPRIMSKPFKWAMEMLVMGLIIFLVIFGG